MSLRLGDTEKWRDPWFRKLPPWGKLLWEYITDNCDIAGVWQVDTEFSESLIGMPIPWDEVGSQFGGRIRVLSADKWLIPKFVSFQFRKKFVPESDRYAMAVLNQLRRHGLSESDLWFPSQNTEGGMEGPTRGLQAPQYKTVQDTTPLDMTKGGSKGDATPWDLLRTTLRGLGLSTSKDAMEEWKHLAQQRAKCSNVTGALEFIAWAVPRGLRDGVNVQFAKHAALYADEWASRSKRAST